MRRDDPLLTPSEAGEYLGKGERFARRLIAERRIEFVKYERDVLIAVSVLEEYIQKRTVAAAADGTSWRWSA
jgi:excisionase family DNA binding protein